MTCDSEDTTTTTTTPKKGAKRRMVEAKWDMHADRSEAKKARKMEIETEFRILKSLIPNIANKQQINELEIIDACVTYIEALQDQLNIRQSRSGPVAAAAAAVSNGGIMSEEVDSVGGDLEPDDLEDENDENEAANGRRQVWPVSDGTAAGLDSESDELSEDDSEDDEEAADSDMEEEEVEDEENNNAGGSSKKTDSPSTKDVAENEEDDASSSSLKSSRRPPTSS